MDWRRFSFESHLDSEGLQSDLIAIEAYKEAALNLVLPLDWKTQLDRLNRIRAVYGTTALEGNPLSEAEVSHQIDILEGATAVPTKTTKEQMQIRNAGRAQEWIRARFHPDSAPLTLKDILTMHEMITEHSDETNNVPGRLRTFSVQVGSPDLGGVHVGAPHDRLDQLMGECIDFVNTRHQLNTHPVIRALLAHFFLVTIHPFGDGNGRVSRLVEAGILFRGGYNVHGFYGLSNYFYRNEREYKTLLQTCRAQQPFDITSFIKFGIEGFAKELRGINNFIKAKLNRVVYRAMLVRAFNTMKSPKRRLLNQREYNLLDFLLTETEPRDPFSDDLSRKVRFTELRQNVHIRNSYKGLTPRTFFRELTRLSEFAFVRFERIPGENDLTVEINFEAIGKY
ncbi:MAG: Fic family protein [Candidatus Rokubacteria bacterium]|nr:Fic family protein [Candidatus Rokubacteria bacterium]